jgi:hypothetical protein
MGVISEMQPPAWRFVWALDGALLLLLFAAVRPVTRRGLALTAAAAGALFFILQARAWFGPQDPGWLHHAAAWETPARAALAVALVTMAGARSKERVGLGLTLASLFFAWQSINHVRHLPLFGIVLAPLLAQSLADWVSGSVERWDAMWRTRETFQTPAALRDAPASALAPAPPLPPSR